MIHSIIVFLSIIATIALIFVTFKIKEYSKSIRNRLILENETPITRNLEGIQVLADILSLRIISSNEANINIGKIAHKHEYLTIKKELELKLKEPEVYNFLFTQFERIFETEFTDSINDPKFSILLRKNLNPFSKDYSVFLKTYTEVLSKLESTSDFINTVNLSRFSIEGLSKLKRKKKNEKMDSLIQIYLGIGIISYFITVISFHRKSKLDSKDNFELKDFDIMLLEESSNKYLQIN